LSPTATFRQVAEDAMHEMDGLAVHALPPTLRTIDNTRRRTAGVSRGHASISSEIAGDAPDFAPLDLL